MITPARGGATSRAHRIPKALTKDKRGGQAKSMRPWETDSRSPM